MHFCSTVLCSRADYKNVMHLSALCLPGEAIFTPCQYGLRRCVLHTLCMFGKFFRTGNEGSLGVAEKRTVHSMHGVLHPCSEVNRRSQ